MKSLAALLLAIFAALAAAPARADMPACSATTSGVSFGAPASTEVYGLFSTGELRVTCSAAVGQTVQICARIDSATTVLRNAAGDELTATTFQDSARSAPWRAGEWVAVGAVAIPASGSATLAAPLTFVLSTPSAQAAVGAFNGVQTITAAWSAGSCAAPTLIGVASNAHSVQVRAACALTTRDLTFGRIDPSSAQPVDRMTSLDVTCTNRAPYRITMSLGNGPGVTSARERRMQGPNGATLAYGLYSDAARQIAWEPVGGVAAEGNGARQTFSVFGRVNPLQSAPAGDYLDRVIVVIEY